MLLHSYEGAVLLCFEEDAPKDHEELLSILRGFGYFGISEVEWFVEDGRSLCFVYLEGFVKTYVLSYEDLCEYSSCSMRKEPAEVYQAGLQFYIKTAAVLPFLSVPFPLGERIEEVRFLCGLKDVFCPS